eukprot:1144581-Pelagomonas_calceolata.AAC.12
MIPAVVYFFPSCRKILFTMNPPRSLVPSHLHNTMPRSSNAHPGGNTFKQLERPLDAIST